MLRTIHVLKWYANNDDRRRVMRQLNKGEALHDLRAYLMIANKGQLRRKRGDELVNQASCLNLVTNAVILWNTVYMAEAVAQLKQHMSTFSPLPEDLEDRAVSCIAGLLNEPRNLARVKDLMNHGMWQANR